MAVRIPRKVRQRHPRQPPLERPSTPRLQQQLILVLRTHVEQAALLIALATLALATLVPPSAEVISNADVLEIPASTPVALDTPDASVTPALQAVLWG